MSATDELRAWAHGPDEGDDWLDRIDEFCDRIDEEHERVVRERRRSCVYYDPERHYCSCHDFDVSGYVELPKDADGEYIHVGDVVDVMPTDKFTGHRDVVVTSVIFKHSAALVTVDTADRPFTFMPNRIRHHHAPTVEDVLREFAEKMNENLGMYTGEAIDADEWRDADAKTIAEYAAKLRLAGDAE